jgi:hypothetical protein
MSIFRNTLQTTVQEQLNARQAALKARTPDAIVYSNSRNSWIRMSSSVNVNGSDSLAKQYILQGGTLNNKNLRYGVGGADKAYSNISPSSTSYNSDTRKAGIAGIRPMPGIESIDIKSKSAYGSLREVTVKFLCHNIQQLEDLELLYMRPGYTVLIEWGWTPYLNSEGKIKNNIEFYNGVIDGVKTREQVWSEIYKLSIKQEHNYDALFGYVKNYNWTARMDGGYECSTTIISIGEIMESLKVNYLPFDINGIVSKNGLLGLMGQGLTFVERISSKNFSPSGGTMGNQPTPEEIIEDNPVAASYSKNILAGLLHEIYKGSSPDDYQNNFPQLQVKTLPPNASFTTQPQVTKTYDYSLYSLYYDTNKLTNTIMTGKQTYITLESFVDLLNKYILLYAGDDANNSTPLVSMSVKSNTYEDNGDPLLCLAHPLQVSIDPTVCLISNQLWAKGISFEGVDKGKENSAPTNYDAQALDIYNKQIASGATDNDDPIGKKLLEHIGYNTTGYSSNNAKEFLRSYNKIVREKEAQYLPSTDDGKISYVRNKIFELRNNYKDLDDKSETYRILVSQAKETITDIIAEEKAKQETVTKAAENAAAGKTPYGIDYLAELAKGPHPFENKNETGIIGNIYVNVDFLYRLSVESSLQTKNQELKLYDFLKAMLKEIQESTGGVNSFEIHVDPIDNVARIIDLNYVDVISKTDAYKAAYQIEAQNLSGTVRSYNLQSKIFPEQAAMISIGAQVKATSAQGTPSSTLLDFNNNLYDRVIGGKYDSPLSLSKSTDEALVQFEKLKNSINRIKEFFFPPTATGNKQASDTTPATNPTPIDYKAALKDIITYFSTIVKTSTNGRSIIPVQISLTMDGIGGLVIGHLFKIPPDLLPRGYGSDSIGGKLIQTITGISHKVANGDWTTTIDAQNIVTNDSSDGITKPFNDLLTETKDGFKITITGVPDNKYPNLDVVPYEQTTVSKAEVIAYLNYATAYDVNVKRSVLAIWRNESGNGSKGVNNNYFGIQADNSKWPESDAYVSGTSVRVDSGNATRRFAVFPDYKTNLNFMLRTIRRRNLVATTAEEWAKKYIYEWVSPPDKEGAYQTKQANLISIYKDSIKDLPK